MSRYRIGQALGFVVDVARERWREVTGDADRERARTQAMVDFATVCDDARRYLRELDAARAEVERLGDVLRAVMDERNAASEGLRRHAGNALMFLKEANEAHERARDALRALDESETGLAAEATRLQEVTEAARAAWPIVARAVDCDADAVLAERLRLALAAAGLPVDEGALPNPGTPAVTARESHGVHVGCST